ncbi:MAG: acireductone synthase [Flavobacteriales bacterium]
MDKQIKYILTDIEGTTSSVSFVYEVLFPYFKEHIQDLPKLSTINEVKQAFTEVIEIVEQEEQKHLTTTEEVLHYLRIWSEQDRKITPLKTLQGLIWKSAYESGDIKGHVYEDVPTALNQWRAAGLKLGVFSSGSIAAQKLLFRYSDFGDLTAHFSNHFDTNTGSKKESNTYTSIANFLGLDSKEILFLSDVIAELEAAQNAGMQTVQLLRADTKPEWPNCAHSFLDI